MSTLIENASAKYAGWPYGFGTLIAVVAVFCQALVIFWQADLLISHIFERDDAFYYFVLARNLSENGMSSFDGIHDTNGVQFLWLLILVPLSWAFGDEITYLRSVLVVCVFFNAVIIFQLHHLVRKVYSPLAAEISVLLWAGVLFEKWDTLEGMEFSLQLAVAIALLTVTRRIILEDRDEGKSAIVMIGVLLALNFWARLDSVVFSIFIWAWVSKKLLVVSEKPWRKIFLISVIPGIAAVLYVAASYAMAETITPISGSAKAIYSARYFDGFGDLRIIFEWIRWWLNNMVRLFLALVPNTYLDVGVVYVPYKRLDHAIALILMVLALTGGVRILRMNDLGRKILPLLTALFTVSAIHCAILVVKLGDFSHVTTHYFAWLLIFWLLFGGIVAAAALDRYTRQRRAVTALAAVLFLVSYFPNAKHYFSPSPVEPENYSISRKALTERLNQTLPSDTIVGSWNAGVLTYFLDRPVVNLDGLMNDKHFLNVLESEAPLIEYIRATDISYLIDHNRTDLTAKFREVRGIEGSDFRNMVPWQELEEIDREGFIHVLKIK